MATEASKPSGENDAFCIIRNVGGAERCWGAYSAPPDSLAGFAGGEWRMNE